MNSPTLPYHQALRPVILTVVLPLALSASADVQFRNSDILYVGRPATKQAIVKAYVGTPRTDVEISIPAQVSADGVQYDVVGIDQEAFQAQHRITGEGPGRCQFTAELLRDPAAAPVGEGIEVTALLSFRWRILEESETAVIQQVLLGEPRQADPNEPSVILRAVHPGEDLWAVAKAYHTTDEAILAASGLDSEEIYPGQRLLIPRTAG